MGKLIGSPSRFTMQVTRTAAEHLAELAESSPAAREAISTTTALLASLARGPQEPPPASAMTAPRRRSRTTAIARIIPFVQRRPTTFGFTELAVA